MNTKLVNKASARQRVCGAAVVVRTLPGVDGKAKMSKSLRNAITPAASPDEISATVRSMYTDLHHQRVEDPAMVEGNVVFAFLDAFETDT